jgi:hypothetical protein
MNKIRGIWSPAELVNDLGLGCPAVVREEIVMPAATLCAKLTTTTARS